LPSPSSVTPAYCDPPPMIFEARVQVLQSRTTHPSADCICRKNTRFPLGVMKRLSSTILTLRIPHQALAIHQESVLVSTLSCRCILFDTIVDFVLSVLLDWREIILPPHQRISHLDSLNYEDNPQWSLRSSHPSPASPRSVRRIAAVKPLYYLSPGWRW